MDILVFWTLWGSFIKFILYSQTHISNTKWFHQYMDRYIQQYRILSFHNKIYMYRQSNVLAMSSHNVLIVISFDVKEYTLTQTDALNDCLILFLKLLRKYLYK